MPLDRNDMLDEFVLHNEINDISISLRGLLHVNLFIKVIQLALHQLFPPFLQPWSRQSSHKHILSLFELRVGLDQVKRRKEDLHFDQAKDSLQGYFLLEHLELLDLVSTLLLALCFELLKLLLLRLQLGLPKSNCVSEPLIDFELRLDGLIMSDISELLLGAIFLSR